jgi:integrase
VVAARDRESSSVERRIARNRRRARGAVGRLPPGRWRARFTTPDGRRLTASFETKRETDTWLAGHTTDISRGAWSEPHRGRITLAEYATKWIDQRNDLRPRTADDYRDIIRVHIVTGLGDEHLAKLTPADVRAWNSKLSTHVPARAQKAYLLLRAILNTAVADEIIVRYPCRVRGAGQDRSAERPIATVRQVAALVDAVDGRLGALVLLAAWCGLRRSELLALRRRDIDLLHATVRVERSMHTLGDNSIAIGPPKTGAGRRTVAIPPHIVPGLETHLANYVGADSDQLLFNERHGGPLRLYTVERAWRKARYAVGLPELRLHGLRHTRNTLAAATAASTKELMGAHGPCQPAGGPHLPARHGRPRPGHSRCAVSSGERGGGCSDPPQS